MLEQKIQKTIKSFKMISPGDNIVVAVSGGPDSVALLHYLKSANNNRLHVVHLNHKIRGVTADSDAVFVRKLSNKMKLPCTIKKANIPSMAKKLKISLEEAGRIARYKFLEETANKINADKIAVAHNADDNIETFLMRIERGSGLRGLCGIPAVREKIIRPLINIWKKEIIGYCKNNNLDYRIDKSNYESKYTRNKIRNRLIPLLLKKDPKLKEKLLLKMTEINAKYASIYKEAEKLLKKAAKEVSENKIALNLELIKQLPDKVKGEVIRHAIEKVKGNLNNISFKHIEDIINLKRSYIYLPENMFASVNGSELIISRGKPEKIKKKKFKFILRIPGKIRIDETRGIAAAFAKKIPDIRDPDRTRLPTPERSDGGHVGVPTKEAYLDYSKIKGDRLIVRSFKKGDKFIPFGMKGHKKLHDYFIDQKIPAEERRRVPIICDKDKIVWIAGYRLDDRVRVDDQTKKVVCLWNI